MKKRIRISSISNMARKAALGVVLASSVAVASNPIKTEIANTNHTEVVSKEGTEALKALAYPMLQQQKQNVPTTHNKALDEKCLKFCDNEEEIKHMNDFLADIYNNNGSYLGSAVVQQNLDVNIFYEFLDGNVEILKRFDENAYNKIDKEAMKKVKEKSGPIIEWLDENYSAVYNKPFGQFDHQPDAEEVNNVLDDYVEKDPNKLFGEMHVAASRYANNTFFEALKKCNMNLVQKNSTFIAYKINTADYLLFKNLLETNGLYSGYNDKKILDNFNIFIRTVAAPKVNN